MAYKQNPLKYSKYSDMPGLEFANEDVAMKERLATNALGVEPPTDLFDGEFFLKDNDPQDFYRTLYIKRGESLDKVVTFTDTGKTLYDGVNEINLDDDEEVKGVLPKRKIITATATVQMNNIQNIVAFDGNKFQEVAKADFVAENSKLSELSKDIQYNLIDDESPITSVTELPYGWNILVKKLDDEPQGLRTITTTALIHKYKRKAFTDDSEKYYDIYIAYLSLAGLYENMTIYAFGSINVDTQQFVWDYDNKYLDLSISTEVSQTGTFSASQTVLMEENGTIKKIPKDEIAGLTSVDLETQTTGNLPVSRVTGAAKPPTHYTTSAGNWVETPLSDGTTMLEGWGILDNGGENYKATIALPKKLQDKSIVVAMGIYYGGSGWYYTTTGFSISTPSIEIMENAPNGATRVYINNWYIKGLLV